MGAVIDDIKVRRREDGESLTINKDYVPFFMYWADGRLTCSLEAFGDDGKSIVAFFEGMEGKAFTVDAVDLDGCVTAGTFILKDINYDTVEREGELIYKIDLKMQIKK